jgi:hypothetical protein
MEEIPKAIRIARILKFRCYLAMSFSGILIPFS